MKTRLWAITVSAFALALSVTGCAPAPNAVEEAPPPPNVIVILADDLGYGDIGANGSTVISTPYIDELAANGVRLTDGYVSAAVCSPMRAGLFTGRYQNRFGYEYNPTANYERNADAELGLPEDETTLGDMMREAGYATGLVGKWHLGFREQYHPLKRASTSSSAIWGVARATSTPTTRTAIAGRGGSPPRPSRTRYGRRRSSATAATARARSWTATRSWKSTST